MTKTKNDIFVLSWLFLMNPLVRATYLSKTRKVKKNMAETFKD